MITLLLLAQVNRSFTLPELGHPGVPRDFSAQVAAVCGEANPQNTFLQKREDRLQLDLPSGAAKAPRLRELGCVRALLSMNGATGREGLLMGTGVSYEVGAARAFAEALLLDAHDSTAAAGLALLALDLRELKDVPNVREALTVAVAADNTRAGPVLRAAIRVALDRGDEAAARRLAQQGVANGHDSTSALLVLARLAARHGDSLAAMQQFVASGSATRAGASREEFDWQLQWFLSPAEDTVWNQLADTMRGRWIRDRLVSRDIRDGRPVGSRLVEHFNRLDYVEANFPMRVPRIKRQQLLSGIATGEQATRDRRKDAGLLGMGTWSCDAAVIPTDSMREYRRWQLDFDDRGVAWMRFGAPEKRVHSLGAPSRDSGLCGGKGLSSGPEPDLAREAWLYHIDGQSMVLSFEGEAFDGSVEATRFVSRALGDYFCSVETKRCNASSLFRAAILAKRLPSEFLPLSDLLRIEEDDRRNITRAVTTDDNSVRSEHPIPMVGQFFRLWDPGSGRPVALTAYALKAGNLQLTATADQGRGAVFALTLRQWDPATGRASDTALTRRVRLPATTSGGEQLTGAMVVPSSPGVTAWSLVASQGDDRQGRTAQESVPPLDAGALVISDIVLGEPRQGLSAMVGSTRVVLAPLGTVDRKSSVSLYYQLRSAWARTDAETTVALYPLDGAPKARETAALEIRFGTVLHAGVNEVERTLDVSRPPPGAYRLEVVVHDQAAGTITRRSATLDIR